MTVRTESLLRPTLISRVWEHIHGPARVTSEEDWEAADRKLDELEAALRVLEVVDAELPEKGHADDA